MNNNNDINIQSSDTNEKHKYLIYLFIFVVLLFFCVFGITYSIYKPESNDSEIETGNIVFTYSDVGQAGNGIILKNAMPISDEYGKVMVGSNQYFDFSITATTKNTNLHYKLLLAKDDVSTLSDQNVRVYLTQLLGGYENELILSDFSNLETEVIKDKTYYVIYEKILDKKLDNYSDIFRFRMWVKEDAINYYDQTFSLKVDVYAYQMEG